MNTGFWIENELRGEDYNILLIKALRCKQQFSNEKAFKTLKQAANQIGETLLVAADKYQLFVTCGA